MWILATLIAAAAQTGRNAAQAGLTGQIGTIGATAVRFIFGLPFAALFLAVLALRMPLPALGADTLAWAALGASAQIAATAFMLVTMRGQGFGIATALMKTEPVTLAIFGAVVLAEPLGLPRLAAILLATLGVVLMSGADWTRARAATVITGIVAGALFGLSAIGFRGAILTLPEGGALLRAALVLVISLAMQSAAMLVWLGLREPQTLGAIARSWRVSILAGALGAFASLFWFIGFALTSAANVRTLALIVAGVALLIRVA